MIRINLLPVRAAQKKEKLRAQASVLILCLILIFVGCGALYVQQMLANDGLTNEIAEIDKKNRELKSKLGEVANFEKKKEELIKKLEVLDSLQAGKTGPVHLLDELTDALPKKVWLTDFSETSGNVTLAGFGDSEHTVADFMDNLENSPYFKNVELKVTERAEVSGVTVQKFNLSCLTEAPPSNVGI